MIDKRYKTISEVSNLLNINKHVIRYWDSKFDGISTRLNKNKRRFFNNENIKKIEELKNILYQNGKHTYSLDLANKIFNKKKYDNFKINSISKKEDKKLIKANIDELKKISSNLKKLLEI